MAEFRTKELSYTGTQTFNKQSFLSKVATSFNRNHKRKTEVVNPTIQQHVILFNILVEGNPLYCGELQFMDEAQKYSTRNY